MEHSLELIFWSPKWLNKIWKDGAMKCVYRRRGCCNDYVDFIYVRMHTIHKPTTTKNEDYKVHINKGCTILERDIK
jgi:hypothetical protein